MKKKNNIYKLPNILENNKVQEYGGLSLKHRYAYYESKENPKELEKSYNTSCFAVVYHSHRKRFLELEIDLDRECYSSNRLIFDDDFVNYYLTILQDYFNFEFSVRSENDLCILNIVLDTYNKLSVVKLFTTTLRYMFEDVRPKNLFVALHLLQQNEDNINLLQLLSTLDRLFTTNSNHSLASGDYYKYSKEKMIAKIANNKDVQYIHTYGNSKFPDRAFSSKYTNITQEDITELNETLRKIYNNK